MSDGEEGLDRGIAALSDVVRAMTDDDDYGNKTIHAPVRVDVDTEGLATLSFGPMSIDDLGEVLRYLGDPEGYISFMNELEASLDKKRVEMKAAQEGTLQQE